MGFLAEQAPSLEFVFCIPSQAQLIQELKIFKQVENHTDYPF